MLLSFSASAEPSYKSLLKKWTRDDRVYEVDNFEARMVWHATYLSDDFRQVRRDKLAELYEWNAEERIRNADEDRTESAKYDVFFVAIYAGSSEWSQIGKDDGKWKVVLDSGQGEPIASIGFQRIPITQLEIVLYPYLDKWSQAYLIRFPKTLSDHQSFRLRMTGIPARSELVWKSK